MHRSTLSVRTTPSFTSRGNNTPVFCMASRGLEVVWDRWVAEGAGGHLFVLAQRYDT
jgi:hypothetical protein